MSYVYLCNGEISCFSVGFSVKFIKFILFSHLHVLVQLNQTPESLKWTTSGDLINWFAVIQIYKILLNCNCSKMSPCWTVLCVFAAGSLSFWYDMNSARGLVKPGFGCGISSRLRPPPTLRAGSEREAAWRSARGPSRPAGTSCCRSAFRHMAFLCLRPARCQPSWWLWFCVRGVEAASPEGGDAGDAGDSGGVLAGSFVQDNYQSPCVRLKK